MNNSGNVGFDPSARDNERDAAGALEPADEDGEPDVLLDVSELRVDELSLEVEDLRARVSTQADVLSLLRLHVGVEAELGGVNLTIKGVEANVLLKVRLDNIAKILDRVMTTIDNNPDIVGQLTPPVGERWRGSARPVRRSASSKSERRKHVAADKPPIPPGIALRRAHALRILADPSRADGRRRCTQGGRGDRRKCCRGRASL